MTTLDDSVDYTNDDTGQLTGADYDNQDDEDYSYDENGNRTMTGYVTGDDNQLLSDGTYRYLYDGEGNRIAKFVEGTKGVRCG
jgi:YD repeat-containing protein